MNYLDTLYRALIDYRKNTLDHHECKLHRRAIVASNNENDVIEVTRKNCVIEEDWIEAIERGLEFIDKAIKEERQFIRSNGEVIPIEKVKRVSKDSVEHLARHSNFFTRAPKEGEDLIPDQLYTVERLSDYAVYENRFLYMLLCYLRDFIGMRYEKIVEQTNTYNGKMSMSKQFSESSRRIKYEVRLEEEKKNDDYLREHNKAQKEIDRILTIYKAVVVYLNTPLMVEVAKSPMVKPPIMRTNVLKMNRNFREALTLYEYITAYDKDGYVITTETRMVSPFVGAVGEEMAEAVDLAFFLTYEHGLGIKDYLRDCYDKEEHFRREEERKKLAEQLRSIGRQIKASGLTAEEYIKLLQKRIHDMEEEEEELDIAKKQIEDLHQDIYKLKEELDETHASIRSLGDEIDRLNKKYAEDLARIDTEQNERVRAVQNEYENRIYALQSEYEEQIRELSEDHKTQLQEVQGQISRLQELRRVAEETQAKEIARVRQETAEQMRGVNTEFQSKSKDLDEKMRVNIARLNAMQTKYNTLQEQKAFNDARLTGLRAQYGLIGATEDYTSKEQVDELERQYEAFKKFFKTEWKKAKKQIRKEVFTSVFAKDEKKKGAPVSPTNTAKPQQPQQQAQKPVQPQQTQPVAEKPNPPQTEKTENKDDKE